MTFDAAEAVALRRYPLIAEAANPRLTPRERSRIVREIAARLHEHPDGSDCVVCRGTVDRWLRAYQQRGPEGLKPLPRSDTGVVRRHPELFQEAAGAAHRAPRSSLRRSFASVPRPRPASRRSRPTRGHFAYGPPPRPKRRFTLSTCDPIR